MEYNASTSVSTVRSLHQNMVEYTTQSSSSVSVPSSPHSQASALPSPPDSPSAESVSSLPSVGSSFFFSSAAASPPHPHTHSDHESAQGLVIPSLMLPDALRRPTPFGQTLGDLRLLVLGSQGAGKSFLTGLLLEDNEDVVEVGTWEDAEYGKVLRASTDWLEHRDAHGLEKYEATRNVEIVELPGYDHNTDGNELVAKLKSIIHSPFYSVSDVLHPSNQPSAVLANLLSSPCTPLYTALIFLMPSSPTTLDRLIINSLGPHVPIIVLPSLHPNRDRDISKLSSFRPPSAVALRVGLFHSPETVALLRSEATDRFLRWREVERAADDVHASRRHTGKDTARHNSKWDKSRWESEWMETLSLDVAKRVREGTITERNIVCAKEKESHPPCINSPFDPLHLPSLFMFSVSLLGPLRSHMRRTLSDFFDALGELNVKLALAGGFLVGVGIGVYAR